LSESRDPVTILSDSRDQIFNSRYRIGSLNHLKKNYASSNVQKAVGTPFPPHYTPAGRSDANQ